MGALFNAVAECELYMRVIPQQPCIEEESTIGNSALVDMRS